MSTKATGGADAVQPHDVTALRVVEDSQAELNVPLPGRSGERGVLRRLARAAAAGAGGAVLVVGEAGIGRTAVLDAAAAEVPLRVLRRGVRTGRLCRYEPDPDLPVDWSLR